jgi:mannonate dehydratase
MKRAPGNALADYKLSPGEPITAAISADEMWDNYQYFLDAVLPVAEESGVRLALHPDDPPVDVPLGGAARIITSPAAIAEAHRRARGSAAWGLNFCIGTVSEMAGEQSINEVIDLLGPQQAIAYVTSVTSRVRCRASRNAFWVRGTSIPAGSFGGSVMWASTASSSTITYRP